LIHDLHIRVVTTDGQLLRESQLDPAKNYRACRSSARRS
jgi:hypothetical protein